MRPETIAFLGKGGIGKSTLSANISAICASQGKAVLHVGCDPKRDSTALLLERSEVRPVLSQEGGALSVASAREFVVRSRLGIDCIEAGGPEPGVGCGGRAIGKTIDILERHRLIETGGYDLVVFDILGDVVCGGFAAPLRRGFGRKVVIVASEEMMSLYAANNVARAVRGYASNGVALCGLVANLRDPDADTAPIAAFARTLGTQVLGVLRRDAAFRKGELLGRCLTEFAPTSPSLAALKTVTARVLALDPAKVRPPEPLTEEDFYEAARNRFSSPVRRRRQIPPSPTLHRSRPAEEPVQALEKVSSRVLFPETGRVEGGQDLIPSLAPTERSGRGSAPEFTRWMMWQWGVPDQWRQFFADAELALSSAKPRLKNTVYVIHKELECFYVEARADDGAAAYFNHAWPDHGVAVLPLPLELRGLGSRQVVPGIKDSEIVLGGVRKLEAALESMLQDLGKTELVVFLHACSSVVTGDDLAPAVERFCEKARVPTVYPDRNADQHTDVLATVFRFLAKKGGSRKRRRRPRSVNLVGFPRNRALEELTGMLSATGIEVNAVLLPEFDQESVRRFPEAELQILTPHIAFEGFYSDVLAKTGIPSLRPAPPYGLTGTRLWLLEIAGRFGLEKEARAVLEERWQGLAPRWGELSAKARGTSLGFVADAERLKKLRDPAWSSGIPLASCLKEMGFGLEWLLWCGCGGGKACPGRGARGVTRFHDEESLGQLLTASASPAFYSDLSFDSRLTRTGKAQFSLPFFEPGLEGGVRTLERLLGAARLPFYREFSAYL
ncbi:MAG: nitrogenase component 1 [Elusimicrobiota bacterium]|jgi:nitrogenase subunit NifH